MKKEEKKTIKVYNNSVTASTVKKFLAKIRNRKKPKNKMQSAATRKTERYTGTAKTQKFDN